MSKTAWLCAVFGWAVAGLIAFAIIYDIGQAETDKTTISRWCLMTCREHPWIVAVIVGPPIYVFGILTGHLFFAQYLSK